VGRLGFMFAPFPGRPRNRKGADMQQIRVVPGDELTRGLKNTTVVPNSILDMKLATGPKLTWIVLWRFCYHGCTCFPSQGKISVMVGCDPKTLRAWLDDLEARSLLYRSRRSPNGVCIYTLYGPSEE